MHALVTGGAGFIGSHIVELLLSLGAKVTVLDDLSSGSRENLQNAKGDLVLIQASVTDELAVRNAIGGADAVFHLAAVASVQNSVENPIATGRVNTEGTIFLLEAAAKQNAKVVLSSSAAIYGNNERLPVDELELPETLSPYAAQKLASEAYLTAFHATHGLRSATLRYFNVYGPRQDPNSEYAAVVPKFVTKAIEGRPLIIFGDGGQTRDFVFVEDVARANLLAFESNVVNGKPVNIGSGASISILGLAKQVIAQTGSTSEIDFQPARLGEVRNSECAVSAARKLIGFEPKVSLIEGLKRTADYWRPKVSA